MSYVYTHAGKSAVMVQVNKADNSGIKEYDFTENVLATNPELENPSIELALYNTMPYEVDAKKGKATFNFKVKKAMTTTSSNAQMTADGKNSKIQQETITFDQEYTAKFQYKNNIDQMVGDLADLPASDLASLIADTRESQENAYYEILIGGLEKAMEVVGSDDAKITVAADGNITAETSTKKLADTLVDVIDKALKTGMKGGNVLPTHPQVRGIDASNYRIITNIQGLNELSKDERFVQAGEGANMIRTGQAGNFLTIPVVITNRLPLTAGAGNKTLKAVLVPIGRLAPVQLVERTKIENRLAPKDSWFTYSELQVEANWQVVFWQRYGMLTHLVTAA